MSLLPSLLSRSVLAAPCRLLPAFQRSYASGHGKDLSDAALGDAAPAARSDAARKPSQPPSAGTPEGAATGVPESDASLYGPSGFYAQPSASSSSSSRTSGDLDSGAYDHLFQAASASAPAAAVRRTVPYAPKELPQVTDPLCDFWIGVTMKDGKKLKHTILLSKILDTIARMTNSPPLPIFRQAILSASPMCRLKSIRRGAKTMIVPVPMNERQRTRHGILWIIKAADKRAAIQFEKRIAMEMLAVLDGTSNALKMVDERHRTAMMNRSNLPRNMGP